MAKTLTPSILGSLWVSRKKKVPITMPTIAINSDIMRNSLFKTSFPFDLDYDVVFKSI